MSKIKIFDVFVEIGDFVIRKSRIDEFSRYEVDLKGEDRFVLSVDLCSKNFNDDFLLGYETETERDEDYNKLLRMKKEKSNVSK